MIQSTKSKNFQILVTIKQTLQLYDYRKVELEILNDLAVS